ncbi:uncharacterized protein L201_006668 [Kwoniella dendrophila CBS 6074]|uniref:Extradiol ring-cleavage dioxygenase class III enzyme subunit B domain-containing protein n=1 Tax=Kwoniella dendrophila CBS 6074 TaxID=1295534 RepID=A0AAX4K1Z5_9TREE
MCDQSNTRGDVYFISHGGPITGDQKHSEPYKALQKIGQIINNNPPKGIIIVSAHWEHCSPEGGVLINSNRTNPVIYDFYNFPKHLYELNFNSYFDEGLGNSVLQVLKDDNIKVDRENRGLDHGIWIPLRAMFGESSLIPLIQISLPDTSKSKPITTVKLGKSLSKLRNKGYTIIGSGQGVHNIRDLIQDRPMPYSKLFLQQLTSSVNSTHPISSTINLLNSPLYKLAHPTNEHFYPIFISLAAINLEKDIKHDIYTGIVDLKGFEVENQGLGWCLWRWTANSS